MQEQGAFRKFVYGCQANNECLPFPDGYFDAYLAPLSLMLVHNYNNMLREAFRVSKPGSRAVFTIWANRDNNLQFTVVQKIINRYKPDYRSSQDQNFNIWNDKGAQLKADMEKVGYTEIKMWEQPTNVLFKDGEEYMKIMGDNYLKLWMKDSGIEANQYDKLR